MFEMTRGNTIYVAIKLCKLPAENMRGENLWPVISDQVPQNVLQACLDSRIINGCEDP